MTQAHPIPDVHARDGLPVENVTCSTVALLGSREGTNQIQLRAGIDHPADAAQNSIHFAESSESIDVHGRKARGLQQEFLVAHEYPRNKLVASRGIFCVGKMTCGKRNRALASSRFFARDQWSKLNTIPFGECSTVVTAPQLLSQVATVDANSKSFSCLKTTSGIGSARETSAMLHPGVADGLTASLAGREGGDRAERRSPFSISINSIPDIARRA